MPAHTELEIARAHRSALQGRLVRLTAERKRLDGVEHAERAARRDLDALGRQEIDAVRAWAAKASTDPAPQPDAARRHELTIALAGAEAGSAAARSAGAALDAEISDVSVELALIAGRIEAAAVDDVFGRIPALWDGIQARAIALRKEIAHVLAATEALRERADGYERNGRPEVARPILNRLAPLYEGMSLELSPGPAEVNASVPEWTRLITDLTR